MSSQILSIRQILGVQAKKNLEVTMSFLDFFWAFDSIQRGKMEILLAYGLLKETVASIMILYTYLPTPPLEQDMTQDQFLSGV